LQRRQAAHIASKVTADFSVTGQSQRAEAERRSPRRGSYGLLEELFGCAHAMPILTGLPPQLDPVHSRYPRKNPRRAQ